MGPRSCGPAASLLVSQPASRPEKILEEEAGGQEQSTLDEEAGARFQSPVAAGPPGHRGPPRPHVRAEAGGGTRCSPRPREPGTSTARRPSPRHILIFENSPDILRCRPVRVRHSHSSTILHASAGTGSCVMGKDAPLHARSHGPAEVQSCEGPAPRAAPRGRPEACTGSCVAKVLSGDCAMVCSRFRKEKPIQLPPETTGSGF